MFGVIANGIQTICKTQRQLECILALYPYPKFKYCKDEAQAREWLRRNARTVMNAKYDKYGDTSVSGYAIIEYFIAQNHIYYNVNIEKVGYVRINPIDEHVKVEHRGSLIKVKIDSIYLNDELVVHHVIAIRRILRLIGNFIDVDIQLRDMSIFLALTKYSGKNYIIKSAHKDIRDRIGGVSYTVQDYEHVE